MTPIGAGTCGIHHDFFQLAASTCIASSLQTSSDSLQLHTCVSVGLASQIHRHKSCREAAEGNDLSKGLKRCLCYAVDLRRASAVTAEAALKVPTDFWGNAVAAQIVMPPPAPTAKGFLPQAGHVRSILAAAACAIHAGTKSIRADPNFISSALGVLASMEDSQFWKTLLAAPGLVPFRDCAAMSSSWRGGTMEKADFGQGKPWIIAGVFEPKLLMPPAPFDALSAGLLHAHSVCHEHCPCSCSHRLHGTLLHPACRSHEQQALHKACTRSFSTTDVIFSLMQSDHP